jgi:hypothetical protein
VKYKVEIGDTHQLEDGTSYFDFSLELNGHKFENEKGLLVGFGILFDAEFRNKLPPEFAGHAIAAIKKAYREDK